MTRALFAVGSFTLAVVALVATAAIYAVFTEEYDYWAPRFAATLTRLAGRFVPASTRDVRVDEWLGDLDATYVETGSCILFALGVVYSAIRVGHRDRRLMGSVWTETIRRLVTTQPMSNLVGGTLIGTSGFPLLMAVGNYTRQPIVVTMLEGVAAFGMLNGAAWIERHERPRRPQKRTGSRDS